MEKKLLLICYSFPPHPGIGGRRWAKFAKYLSDKGFDITVFNAKNFDVINSLWTSDVDTTKIKVINHEFDFQKLVFFSESFFNKIIRKIFLLLVKFTRYTPDIITSFPNKKLWNNVEAIIKQKKIKNVIVTGDPFLFYYASQLKKKIDFNLVLDYRDLWNDHSFYDEFVSLSEKQKVFFEKAENYAVNNCDQVVCVDECIKQTIGKRVKNNTKITVINNGFDKDELISIKVPEKDKSKIKMVFAGGISSDNNNLIEKFVDSFISLKNTSPDLFNKIELTILSPCDETLIKKFKTIDSPNFFFEDKFLDKANYLNFIGSMHFGIIFISKEYTGSFATKFADYLNLNVLTISLGYKGGFSEFIEKNKIGIHFDGENINMNFFEEAVILLKNHNEIDKEIIKKFDLEYLAGKVEKLLI